MDLLNNDEIELVFNKVEEKEMIEPDSILTMIIICATVLNLFIQDWDNLTDTQIAKLKNICDDLEYMQKYFDTSKYISSK